MTAIRTRLEALELAVRPTSNAMLNLESLTDDERAFLAEIGISESSDREPDYSQLSVPDLRRLADIAEQHARVAS